MAMQAADTTTIDLSRLLGLRPDQIERILGCGSEVQFASGAFIFHVGEGADSFFIIQQGLVALEVFIPGRGAHTIATLHGGEVLGWSWLFPPHRWHFDAQALERTRLLAFSAPCLRGVCETDCDIGYPLVRPFAEIITQRLQATRLQLVDMYRAEGA
jgi:CRP/FNR family cyclic AMP-dependent transcriptional regulator